MSALTSTATSQQHGVLRGDAEVEDVSDTCRRFYFWLQSRVALVHLKLDIVVGERNPADTLTKAMPGRRIREWSAHVGQTWLQESQL